MAAANEAGIKIEGPCGGKGTCGKCTVSVREIKPQEENTKDLGQHSPGLMQEDFKKVLACQSQVQANLVVMVPQVVVSIHRKSQISQAGATIVAAVEPGIKKMFLTVDQPSLDSQISDRGRLMQSLATNQAGQPTMGLAALRSLPQALRAQKHQVTAAIYQNHIIAVEAGDTSPDMYGIAVDMGTTSVVASLFNLHSGAHISTASTTNIQNMYGADVISRITYCVENKQGLEQLHQKAIQVLNSLINQLCGEAHISCQSIYKMTLVGNTTITHLLAKLSPVNLAPAPFIPVEHGSMTLEARDLDLNLAPHAPVIILPNIAGYLGSDTVGVILATKLLHSHGNTLVIDIGTNGEIVLAAAGRMVACSTAAGPAFEGAQIKHGMRAAEGAIEQVIIDNEVSIKTIGAYPPRGICGSGLLDAVAQMLKAGIIDSSGKIIDPADARHLPKALQERLGSRSGGKYFVLARADETSTGEPVLLTQKDVRELQLAKGAIKAGAQVLMQEQGLELKDIDEILLAGAFGNYIQKDSALAIGLLPPVAAAKIKSVGNAAGVGAQMALLSQDCQKEADLLAQRTRHVELSTHGAFQDLFIQALGF